MEIHPQQLTVEQYAAIQGSLGAVVERVGQVYWTRGSGCFWRPLLPYEAYSSAEIRAPRGAWGGFQHVISGEREANSWVSFLMLDGLEEYQLGRLSHNRRRLISNAAKQLEVREVRDLHELQEQGFAAYLSFYQRTNYSYLSSRRRKGNFCRWAETLLRDPRVMVLGAYGSGGLGAVSVSYWVKETLLYATYFSHSDSLRQGASELMFHTLRLCAARTPGIQQVFVRRYQGGNGMDRYYLTRGAKIVHKPARLHLHPALNWVLKHWLPQKHALLWGAVGTQA
jgi:hypothetical protein